jgi:hypothetical protein
MNKLAELRALVGGADRGEQRRRHRMTETLPKICKIIEHDKPSIAQECYPTR